ncbi:MAG: DoxX family protein [Burkholderiaceae bacterium]
MNAATAPAPSAVGIRGAWNRIADRLDRLIVHDALALIMRVAIAAVFWLSGRTKVDGFLTVNETAFDLFRDEYRVPLLPPEVAAYMATYAETFFPILLVLGLFTRLSAFALLIMTAVIEIFVYPLAWPTHLTWAALMLYLIGRGAGRISLDHLIKVR